MWRSPLALLTLVLAAGLLVLLLIAHAPNGTPSATGCQLQYHPVGFTASACAVPNGGSFDPCSIVTAGLTNCPFTLPDLNPADWLGWLGCAIGQDIGTIGSDLLKDATGFVTPLLNTIGSWLTSLLTSILNDAANSLDTVATAIVNAVLGVTNAVAAAFDSLSAGFSTVAAGAGPLAPVVVAALIGLVIIAGTIGIYIAILGMIGLAKTLFNLA